MKVGYRSPERDQQPQRQYVLLLLTALLLGLSMVGGRFPGDQTLQNIPTITGIAAIAVLIRNQWISITSLMCVLAFVWLHILGARYVYSLVPYDEWTATIFGSPISDWFGWGRNHYDRLVHLAFGILFMPPLRELAERFGGITGKWSVTFALMAVLAVSALYEVFEWAFAHIMAPDRAERYNGQQGDMWDAQKDMALALLGAVMVIPILTIRTASSKPDRRPVTK